MDVLIFVETSRHERTKSIIISTGVSFKKKIKNQQILEKELRFSIPSNKSFKLRIKF